MQNSLTVFFAFLAFLCFGYLSLLRILYQQQFNEPFHKLFVGLSGSQGLQHIGSSAFFISLPATTLLLFWGWGPALLWLFVFHFLADSLVNLQVTGVDHRSALSEYLVPPKGGLGANLMRAILQLYLVLLLSIVLAMLAQLIDKKSGLLFALIGLIPSYLLLRNSNPAIPNWLKNIGALLILTLACIFANQLGFAMYGDWAPLGDSVKWLRFNNTTVLAAILLVGGSSLANNQRFADDVSKLAGGVVIATIVILTIKLVWLHPALDAPLNSVQLITDTKSLTTPPFLLGFCLFLFAGMTTLFFRVFNSTAPSDGELTPAADFARVQAESVLQLLLALLLVLSLAAALGIGAWKTHFLDWQSHLDFIAYLNLSISSLLNLIDSQVTAGIFMHTLMMASLSVAGLSFLRVCIKALSLAQETKKNHPGVTNNADESLLNALIESKLLQIVCAFILSCYFINRGVSIDTWVLLGILSWVVVMQLIIGMTVEMQEISATKLIYATQCTILLILGYLQIIWSITQWAMSGQYFYLLCSSALLLIGSYLWFNSVIELIRCFKKTSTQPLSL